MGDGFGTEERSGAGKALVRLGYALAGALVAVLVSWAASYAIQSMTCLASLSLFFESAAMGATLMLWASFKPSRGSAVSIACEAMVVVGGMLAVRLGFESLFSSGSGFFHDPASWLMGALLFMLLGGYGFALPASWALGSSARWARRPLGWVVVELLVAVAAGLLASNVLASLPSSAFVITSFLTVILSLPAAAVVQRLLCGVIMRVRGERAGAPVPPLRPAVSRHAACADAVPRRKLRIVSVAAFVASVAVCARIRVLFRLPAARRAKRRRLSRVTSRFLACSRAPPTTRPARSRPSMRKLGRSCWR